MAMADEGAGLPADARITRLRPNAAVHRVARQTARSIPNNDDGEPHAPGASETAAEANQAAVPSPVSASPARTESRNQPRGRRRPPKLTIKPKDGKLDLNVRSDEDLTRLVHVFGSKDTDFTMGLLNRLIEATGAHRRTDGDLNGFLAGVAGIAPNDEIEGMLAAQIVATNDAALSALGRLALSESVPEQDSNGNIAIKLLRTYMSLVETLQRYRGKAPQEVRVENVNVNDGGQAIVGKVDVAGRKRRAENTSHVGAGVTDASRSSVRSEDPERGAVPGSRGSRKAAV